MDAVIIFGVALIPSLLVLLAAIVQYFLWDQKQEDDNDDDEGDRAEQWQDAAYAPLVGLIDPVGDDDEPQTLQRCNPS